MDRAAELEIIRRAYAQQCVAATGRPYPRLEAAFMEIPREDYLGPGPWPIQRGGPYVPSPSADPVYIYADVLVGLIPERQLNNGVPSWHAMLLAAADPQPGDHAVHVGAGTGYYTALMAHLVAPTGRVTAIEFEPVLATQATINLARHQNVLVLHGNAMQVAFDAADILYLNAGVNYPPDVFLDRLKDGGRMILPLTTDAGRGVVFRILRQGEEFHVRWVSYTHIYAGEGMRDAESEQALSAAFAKNAGQEVTRLYRTGDVPGERCWLKAPAWCLAYS